MKQYMLIAAASVLFVFLGCQRDPSIAELQIDFQWSKSNECSETSPEIRVEGLPATARTLRVRLIDLYQPGADHGDWGQPIPLPPGGVIPVGGLKHFRGPCPPKYYGQSNYEFTVEALDQDGVRVAEGQRAQKCCPDW